MFAFRVMNSVVDGLPVARHPKSRVCVCMCGYVASSLIYPCPCLWLRTDSQLDVLGERCADRVAALRLGATCMNVCCMCSAKLGPPVGGNLVALPPLGTERMRAAPCVSFTLRLVLIGLVSMCSIARMQSEHACRALVDKHVSRCLLADITTSWDKSRRHFAADSGCGVGKWCLLTRFWRCRINH